MQIITISGGIGRDAEIRRLQDGTPVASFSVGVGGRNSETTWWDVSLFGVRGEKLAPFLTKGSKVTVVGAFSTREHNGKTYLQCRASEVALQGGGQRQQDTGGYGGAHGSGEPDGMSKPSGDTRSSQQDIDLDDEIPF